MRSSPLFFEDLRAPLVAEPVADRVQLVDDHLHQQLVARQDRAQPLDGLHQLGQLVEDLLALEAGQALQLHVEDRLRLHLRQLEGASSGLRALRPGFASRESA